MGSACGTARVAPLAQPAWPNKPIRIIVSCPPGGFTDQVARIVQGGLQNRLRQTLTVDNKPGANTIIGRTIHPLPALGESIGLAAEVAHVSCTDLPPARK